MTELTQWITPKFVIAASLISLGVFIISACLSAYVLIQLPQDYFLKVKLGRSINADPFSLSKNRGIRLIFIVLKNIVGLFLFIVGLIFLLTPGQGVLTILLGLALIDFPGKRKLIIWLLDKPAVQGSLNTLRARFNKKPFIFP